ncbi:MAG: HlyC/CorC family transporter [Alistipes sp.]|nr:HlyC/CorC family transporter [Alistipes sp.]MBQ5854883.1 HlyC/CorC family transporter [Alistipes sp.]
MGVSIVIILLMLLLSAFFSGMELAFLNKNRLKLEIDRKQSRMFDYIANLFSRNQGQYITTILVGNNITLVIYSMCMSQLIRGIAYLLGWDTIYSQGSFLLETIIPTVIVIFVAEYIPKSVVRGNPNFYYRFFAPVIFTFYILLYPVARLTTLLSYGVLRLFGRTTAEAERHTEFDRADLESLLDANNVEQQTDSDAEIKMFQNALDFADLRVRDCMVSRVDVEAVDIDEATIESLTERFVESKYSRIFVWSNSIDNIVGYVNSKSLFKSPDTIKSVLMSVDYVAETMPLQDMLTHFIKQKSNIAVVIDEFGGTAGIISLEDVLEQIFGEIEDEHDETELVEKELGEGEYVFSCRLEVEYLNEKYGLGIEESDEYDTLAGYIISRYQELPAAGTQMEVDGMKIKILRTTRSRIELAKVQCVKK